MLSSRDVSSDLRRLAPLARTSLAGVTGLPRDARQRDGTGQGLVLALIVAVAVVDQAAKWWAWRHVPWTKINSGGDVLVGPTVGGWYAAGHGALLDLLDVGLLGIALALLARCRVPAAVSVPGALMIGGWCSNLLDRLGAHYWTAPGSVRGVVDFIHLGGHYYNVADFFIMGCTPLFLLAAAGQGALAARRRPWRGACSRPCAAGRGCGRGSGSRRSPAPGWSWSSRSARRTTVA